MDTVRQRRTVFAGSYCLTCRRSIVARALLAPGVHLGEPTFCAPCGRPRDAQAALFLTAAWGELLARLRGDAGPRPKERRTKPWREAGLS